MHKFKGTIHDIVLVLIALTIGFYYKPHINLQSVLGFIITITAITFWLIARYQLGEAFSITPQSKYIVSGGLYKKIRHPIYLCSIMAGFGLCLIYSEPYLYIPLLILIIIQAIRAKLEERVLIKKFGQQYLQYKNSTWF